MNSAWGPVETVATLPVGSKPSVQNIVSDSDGAPIMVEQSYGNQYGTTYRYDSQGWSSSPGPNINFLYSSGLVALPNSKVMAIGPETNSQSCNETLSIITGPEKSTPTQSLSLKVSGSGTVTSDPPGISCTSSCSAIFSKGVKLTLTASPSTGYKFANWSGACSGSGACVVQISSDLSVTANFTQQVTPAPTPGQSYQLKVAKSPKGNISSTPAGINCGLGSNSCNASFPSNSTVTLTATPKAGYKVNGWGGCSSTTGATCTMVIGRNPTRVSVKYAKI